jgi:hypothetical protein
VIARTFISPGPAPPGAARPLLCIAIEKKERINNSFLTIYVADTVDKKCEDVAATQVLRKERTSIKAHNGHPEGEEQSSPVLRSRSSVFAKLSRFISIMSEK